MKKLEQIAEIGQAHDGSLGMAHSYIESLKGTEITSIKFQMHIAEAESSDLEKFRVNFSFEDKTRFDYWKRMEFTEDQWIGLKNHCEDLGFEFLVSPFSIAALNLIDKLKVKRIKIGSGETLNYLLIDQIKKRGMDIILSTGMDSIDDIRQNISNISYDNLSLLHCTTAYPTTKENYFLNRIRELKHLFGDLYPVGFSDHSGDPLVLAAGVGYGAEILEYHIVFDKNSFGPDSTSSIEVRDIAKVASSLKNIYESQSFQYSQSEEMKSNKTIFGKSICVNKNLPAGHRLKLEDLESKKPGDIGIPANHYLDVVGKRINKPIHKYNFLKLEDLK